MYCKKCGTQLNESVAFCNTCGTSQANGENVQAQNNKQVRTITIKREGIFGTEPMSVFIDDGEYAILRLREEKTFPISEGTHRLQVRASTHAVGKDGLTVGQGNKNSYNSDVFYIKATDDLSFSVKINMFGKITLKQI